MRASMAACERLGVPEGFQRICGANIPDAAAERLRPILYRIAAHPGSLELAHEAALRFLEHGVWALRPYMRDTPQWVRGRIVRRRQRLLVQRAAEERVRARIMRTLTRMEEEALLAEEDRMEHERR